VNHARRIVFPGAESEEQNYLVPKKRVAIDYEAEEKTSETVSQKISDELPVP
jgi:hypothetical protein